MGHLILIRHGQSEWNKKNVFTGWIDVPLSLKGIDEAFEGGQAIKDLPIDIIFSSTLIRGIMTALLVMNVHHSGKIPYIVRPEEKGFEGWYQCHNREIEKSMIPLHTAWQLNERMYGALQGLNKDETRAKYGENQVHLWRRSFDVAPPQGESLKMTSERTIPYFKEVIEPELKKGKNVLVSAHGNSLRSIVMALEGLSEEEIVKLEIATGVPLIYSYENGVFRKTR
jgi:2,3-bisphosphoglycerate-dependent phosphoglycerate mutase